MYSGCARVCGVRALDPGRSKGEPIMQNTSAASATVNLTELLENSRIGPLQIRVFVLCMAC